VHLLVLEDRPERFPDGSRRIGGPRLGSRHDVLEERIGGGGVRAHRGPGGPGGVPARDRERLLLRVDPSGEDRLEMLVDSATPERALHERVHRKGRKVPLVEDHRIAQLDRARVVRRVVEEIEERPRPGAAAAESVEDAGQGGGRHVDLV
jgi:hypothetical protein